ncbi:MAG TPA: SPOR domain-containing protein [Allosphingosinicella sp.]|nr:SPOR domain-containing protein [Allosphingosinicella sp.]
MKTKTRAWLLAAACTLAGTAAAQPPGPAAGAAPPHVASPSVRAGIEAWAAQNWPLAIANFRPLADRGDADAQYAMAQAYFLGRGVPQNTNLAEQWYERAARQGNEEAQANYGLLLFQNGRRREALPWIERAANRGDPRAQYVLGTALFNGDLVGQDSARAYALMSRAAEAGLPPAISQLAAMEPHISAEDRARGLELARRLPSAPPPVQIAAASPPSPPAPARYAPPPPPAPRVRPQPAPAPAPAPAAGGRWRVQLGAFGSEANARRAWSAAAGRLAGLQPYYVRAGNVIRVQAGPLRDRAAAARACASVGGGCFPVAP